MSLTTATGPIIDQPVPFGPIHFYSGDTGSFVLVIATSAPSDLTVKVYPRRSTVANAALTPTLVAITGSPNKRVQFTAEQTALMLNETMSCLIYFGGQNQYKADITATLEAKGQLPSTEVSISINTGLADVSAAVLTAQASATAAGVSATTATTKASEAATSATTALADKNTATAQAGIATTKASEAATSAASVFGSATTATTQAGIATTKASEASVSAASALVSAGTATTKAGESGVSAASALADKNTATTKASEASASAVSASGSATTATTKASEASASAGSALTDKNTATTQAGIATTQAGMSTTKATESAASAASALADKNTATAQAGTATTKATEASASAASASGSATTAANQATTATTKATEASASATSASGSATTATTKATEASASATGASGSATTATNQAGISTTKATEASTSAASALVDKNTVLAYSTQFKGARVAGTAYVIGDRFTFRGSTYQAIVNYTAVTVFNRAQVTMISQGLFPTGAWVASTQYYINDLATVNGSTFRRLNDAISGATFSGVGADWELVAEKGNAGTLTTSAFVDVATPLLTDKLVVQRADGSLAKITPDTGYPTIRPSLNLDFAGGGIVSPQIAHTRTGVLSYFDRTGIMRFAGANVPAIDYDPLTLACLGLSCWEGRTNVALFSAGLSGNAGASVTVTYNAILSPDSTINATLLTNPTAGSDLGLRYGTNASSAVSTTYTLSVFAKAGTSNWLAIRYLAVGANSNAWFNLSTGAVGTKESGITSSGIQNVGNGWYRCWVVATTPATIVNNLIDIKYSDSDATLALSATRTISLYGLQLTAGAFPVPYIPTTSVAVTRGIATHRPPLPLPLSGAVIVQARFATATAVARTLLSFVTALNRLTLFRDTDSIIKLYHDVTTPATLSSGVTAAQDVPVKIAISYNSTTVKLCVNGGTVNSMAVLFPIASVTNSLTGTQDIAGTAPLNGYVMNQFRFAQMLSDAQLQLLTT